MRTEVIAACLIVAFHFTASSAHAQLTFCNEAPLTIQTVVGLPIGPYWNSEGWVALKPGECSEVISGSLSNRYYYAYAETPGRKWTWGEGDITFCVDEDKDDFVIGQNRCDAENQLSFSQIDTLGNPSLIHPFACPQCLDSRVADAVSRNTNSLEGLANQAVPLSYTTPDWVDIGPVEIKYGLDRSPLRIEITDNRISISARLSYWISVSHTRLFGIRTGLASCGVDEPRPQADILITTVFGITEEGKLSSRTHASISFPTPCNLTMFNIDARDRIQSAVQPQLDRAAELIDGRIGEIDVSGIVNVEDLY